jgi:acetyl-CoA acetyltransferase
MIERSNDNMNLHDKAAIVGIGETEMVRRSERGVKALIIEACQKAMADAKIDHTEIDGIVTEGWWVLHHMRHHELAHNLGINCHFSASIGNTGSGVVGSLYLAALAVASGQAKTVLTYYSNDYGSRGARGVRLYGDTWDPIKMSFEKPYGQLEPGVYFAQLTRRYMHDYGVTSRQLGSVAVNQRYNALLNGKGVRKTPLSYEDYEKSPILADPLRKADCCLVNDGACAWIVTSSKRAKDFPHKPVYISGIGYVMAPQTNADGLCQKVGHYYGDSYLGLGPIEPLDEALKMAGITRKDLDFIEMYDAFTPMVLITLETMGFCKRGEAGAFSESGATKVGGSLPVNTHGGHIAHSFLNMASHVTEAVRQIRGEAGAGQVRNARNGLLVGGTAWDNYNIILRRD